MGGISEGIASQEACNRQSWDAKDRTAKLTFRTRIKRLQRRTICFSKSEVMHDAVLKLHIHHLNPLHPQI